MLPLTWAKRFIAWMVRYDGPMYSGKYVDKWHIAPSLIDPSWKIKVFPRATIGFHAITWFGFILYIPIREHDSW